MANLSHIHKNTETVTDFWIPNNRTQLNTNFSLNVFEQKTTQPCVDLHFYFSRVQLEQKRTEFLSLVYYFNF